ncbi:hypothetical protein BOX15_Mlig021349g12, partial [Macrostomum lignano]
PTMRKLRFHEKKLLKKVDLVNWSSDHNLREVKMMRKYRLKSREELTLYNKLSREVRDIARKIRDLPESDAFREEATRLLLGRLHALGIVPTRRNLLLADKVTTTTFCRRRLSAVMVRCHMAETVKAAVTFVEAGHVRVGPQVVTDPGFLVSRSMEDYVTWTNQSAIRRRVLEYNEAMDDYDFRN